MTTRTNISKWNKKEVLGLELTTFFHPIFLMGVGLWNDASPGSDNYSRGYYQLRRQIFFQNETDMSGFLELARTVLGKQYPDEDSRVADANRRIEEWLTKSQEYRKRLGLRTVEDLLSADGIYGVHGAFNPKPRRPHSIRKLGQLGIERVQIALGHFGLTPKIQEERPSADAEKALAAVKLVTKD